MRGGLKILRLTFRDRPIRRVRGGGIAKTAGWGKMSCINLPVLTGHNDKKGFPVVRRLSFPLDTFGETDLQVMLAWKVFTL